MFQKILRIVEFLKNYKGYSIGYLIAVVLNVFFEIFSFATVIPFVQIIIDGTEKVLEAPSKTDSLNGLIDQAQYEFSLHVVNVSAKTALIHVCIVIVVIFFLKNLIRYFSLYLLAPIRNGVVRDIRIDLYKKILLLPVGYLNDKRKGDLITRITTDIQEIQVSVIHVVESLIKDPLMIIGSLVTMLMISPSLTMMAFLVLPVGAFIISSIVKRLKKSTTKGLEKIGELITVVEETLSGFKIIKGFNMEPELGNRFSKLNNQNYSLQNRIQRIHPMIPAISEFLGVTVLIFILFYGAVLVLDGEMRSTTLIFYLIVFAKIISPAKAFSNAFGHLKRGEASLERVNSILNVPVEDESDLDVVEAFKSSIEFKDVSFAYKEDKVVKNVSFELIKGKKIALVGASGSGKSTLAELLSKFYKVEEGGIYMDGKNINQIQSTSLRNLMGIVTQESLLFNESVFNNIALGMKDVSEVEVQNAAKLANAHEFISNLEFGYRSNVGDRGSKLSGGQKQRITIARALLKNPPILVLDEATSALDTESEKIVQEALDNLMKERTSLIVAHRLSTIQNADEILVMDNGSIVERGTHDELIDKNGIYHNLVSLQSFE